MASPQSPGSVFTREPPVPLDVSGAGQPLATAVSEAQLSAVLAIAVDAIISVDQTGTIVQFNRGAEQTFGYEAHQMIGRQLDALLPPRFRAAHARHMHAFAAGPEVARRMGERREIFGLRSNGEEFPAEASIAKMDTGTGLLFTVLLRDVTDRKRAEAREHLVTEVSRALSNSLEFDATLRAAVAAPVPVLADACVVTIFDDEDRQLTRVVSPHADPGVARLLAELEAYRLTPTEIEQWLASFNAGDVQYVPVVDDAWYSARVPGAMRGVLRDLGVRSFVSIPLAARGRIMGTMSFLRTRAEPFDAADVGAAREIAGRAAFAVDNARLYAAARRATHARDEVLGVVSHDLRNPLGAIGMLSRVLADVPPPDEAGRRELAQAIIDASDWANRLIQDLLDVSSIEAGRLSVEREVQYLAPVIERAVDMARPQAESRSITLQLDVDAELPPARVDAERVLQLLGNLLGNAVKFTGEGGTIRISAGGDAGDVVIAVRDTGPGIQPEHLPHVFERYWQQRHAGRPRGSGLGLAIVKGIAEAHGGRVWVESTVGIGSTFYVVLPAYEGGGGEETAGDHPPGAQTRTEQTRTEGA